MIEITIGQFYPDLNFAAKLATHIIVFDPSNYEEDDRLYKNNTKPILLLSKFNSKTS